MQPCACSRSAGGLPCSRGGVGRGLGGTRRVQRVPRASPQPPSSTTEADPSGGTLSNLDALLGQDQLQDLQQQPQQKQQLPWWRIPPKQAAPPRQGLMTPTSQFGRFIPSGEGLFMRHVRTGRPTLIGEPLDVPRVEPFACYLLAAAQAAVYATATLTNNTQAAAAVAGDAPDIPQLALALALHPAAVHTDAWQLATSLLVHASAPHLVLDLALLLLVAPEVEALFGHSLLLLLFCLAGVTGGTAAVAAAGGTGTDAAAALAGASLGVFGLVGSYLGYCIASPAVSSSAHRNNTSSSSSAGSKSSTPMTAAVAAGVAGTLCLSVFTPLQLTVSPWGHGAALAAGCCAGYLLGPKFVVIQEVDIPEGSMVVPEDALETRVVMDQRSGSSRMLAGVVLSASLAASISWVLMQ